MPFAFKDLMIRSSCNSHYLSHFAAFFIVVGTKRSTVWRLWILIFANVGLLSVFRGRLLLVVGAERQPPKPPERGKGSATPLVELGRAQTDCSEAGEKIRKGGTPEGATPKFTGLLFQAAFHVNDPSAGSPTETLLRLLLPLNDKVQATSRR